MATAVNMCARQLTKISRISHSVLFNNHIRPSSGRLCMTTTATNGRPEEAESKPVDAEAGKAAPSSSTSPEHEELIAAQKKLTEENEKLQSQITDFKDKYLRSLAETENVRTRMKKQVDDARQFGIQGFCKDMLEVADILGKANESVPQDQLSTNTHLKDLFQGLSMTESQLHKVFTKHGLHQIAPNEGEKFDPFFHEALFQVPTTEKEGGTVALTQKIGYRLHDRTIRPALVGVFKNS